MQMIYDKTFDNNWLDFYLIYIFMDFSVFLFIPKLIQDNVGSNNQY